MTHFETVTCSRCGGSGRYSYCQMYGDICFKCHGKKVVYTKRGGAAKHWFESHLSKRAGELRIGEKIYVDMFFTRGWSEVLSISPDTTLYNGASREDYIDIQTRIGGQCISRDTVIRVAHTAEEKQVILALALQYQENLTKAGKPRKEPK